MRIREFLFHPLFLLLLYSLPGCKTASDETTDKKAVNADQKTGAVSETKETIPLSHRELEEKAIDTVFSLAEVKELAKNIKQTGARLKIWVEDTSGGEKYFWVRVGEESDTNVVPVFDFHVYPESMYIMYFDITDEGEISLDSWRKKLRQ